MRCLHRPRTSWLLALAVAVLPVVNGCEMVAPAGLTVVAENVSFTPQRVRLPAGVPIQVTLRNADAGIPHGVQLMPMRSGVEARVLFASEIVTGVAELSFALPVLQPGPYLFTCPVHPTMQIEAEAV